MQRVMVFAGDIDETLRESFTTFQKKPLNSFKVNIRRTRAAQLRQMLSNPDAIDLQTFLYEIWNIESKTYLHGHDIDLRIFEKPTMFSPSLEQLLDENVTTLEGLEAALATGDLELHGNYIWGQATRAYDIRTSKSTDQKLEQIHKAFRILNNSVLSPVDKAHQIIAISGFGEGNATGLVMVFHPDEFALVNTVSKGVLKKLGVNLTHFTSLEVIQSELYALREALGASDFLELDWFLYLCSQGEYPLGVIGSEKGDGVSGTWFLAIKKVLEDADESLSVSEITIRALASGLQTMGKTPERTVSKVLTTNPLVFERVREGVYGLKQQAELVPTPQPSPIASDYIEPSFEQIVQKILAQGMSMDERTLRRYHLALKTRGFVILCGISGIGKTWLAEAYANAVGAEYHLVPVAPNWTTNEDLLGYVDPLNELHYHHTGFSYFLEAAAQEYEQARDEKRTAKPYHMVLDEMNLARVEYYFATFLSKMEVRARSGAASIDLGAQKVINLYPNLFFIGTINIDETTHGFADKIYDRAQLIELTVSRDALKLHIGEEPYSNILMAIRDVIHEVAPFAYRVLDEIRAYITAATNLGRKWEEALDEQILQKILPKCKGADLRIGDALKNLEGILSADTYPLSRAKVQYLLEGFQKHGFASYF
jgi:hypothetical protein